jgi:hypothetical protein
MSFGAGSGSHQRIRPRPTTDTRRVPCDHTVQPPDVDLTSPIAISEGSCAGITPVLVHNAGGACPVNLGRSGEAAAKIVKNTKKIKINGRDRIPDGIDDSRGAIQEVKNAKRQGLTRQINDSIDIVKGRGYTFEIIVRRTTKISKPLQKAVNASKGNIRVIRRKM